MRFSKDSRTFYHQTHHMGRLPMHGQNPDDTILLSQLDDLDELPEGKVFKHLKKKLMRSDKPSIGLEIARKIGVIEKLFPELHQLYGVPQDPQWHPEGDVWIHTLLVVDEAAKLKTGDPFQDLCLMLAALCHDLGKPATTQKVKGRWISYGHAEAGECLARQLLERITDESELITKVSQLVKKHLHPTNLFKSDQEKKVGNNAIRRLSMNIDIPLLVRLAEADFRGRVGNEAKHTHFEAGTWLLKRYKALLMENPCRPEPILMSKHLLNLGLKPGKIFGLVLKQALELQIEGKITCLEDAISWVNKTGNRFNDH